MTLSPSMRDASRGSALRVRNLHKRYKDVEAVAGLDLDVQVGECFGLLGPNGAGKTTTIEICEGLTEPDSGDVEVLGRRWATSAGELRQRLGHGTPQSIFQRLLFMAHNFGRLVGGGEQADGRIPLPETRREREVVRIDTADVEE